MREALGSHNGVGPAGISEHAVEQRAGTKQRNTASNRFTGATVESQSSFH